MSHVGGLRLPTGWEPLVFVVVALGRWSGAAQFPVESGAGACAVLKRAASGPRRAVSHPSEWLRKVRSPGRRCFDKRLCSTIRTQYRVRHRLLGCNHRYIPRAGGSRILSLKGPSVDPQNHRSLVSISTAIGISMVENISSNVLCLSY